MFKKYISSLLAFVLLFTSVGPLYSNALASSSTESEVEFINLEELQPLLNETEMTEEQSEIIIETRALPVPLFVIAVQIVKRGVKWAAKEYGDDLVNLALKSSAHKAAKKIKASLLDDDGVILSKFTTRISGQERKDPKSKWTISRDSIKLLLHFLDNMEILTSIKDGQCLNFKFQSVISIGTEHHGKLCGN